MLAVAITHRRRGAGRRDTAYYEVAEHQACAELHSAGALRAIYRRTDGRGAVIVLEAVTLVAVIELLDRLPLVDAGVSGYRVLPVETFPFGMDREARDGAGAGRHRRPPPPGRRKRD